MTMEQAIGLPVPSAKGTAPYSRTDLKYDMQTGLIELIPLSVEQAEMRGTVRGNRRLRSRTPARHPRRR
jgi:hypothetical protein